MHKQQTEVIKASLIQTTGQVRIEEVVVLYSVSVSEDIDVLIRLLAESLVQTRINQRLADC
jgi:hypothetical protein